MRKIRKAYNVKIVAMAISLCLLYTGLVCADETLRVPFDPEYDRFELLNQEKVDSQNQSIENAVIAVGCSGSGKNTMVDPLLGKNNEVVCPKLITTRELRHGVSSDGMRIFVDEEAFKKMRSDGKLTMVRYSHGHWYGLEKDELRKAGNEGKAVLFDTSSTESLNIIKKEFPHARIVLILPRSFEELKTLNDEEIKDILEKRISKRSKLTDEELKARLKEGLYFLRDCHKISYDLLIVNDFHVKINANVDTFENFVVASSDKENTVETISSNEIFRDSKGKSLPSNIKSTRKDL
ncbi:MAG: hypothetical protein KKD11_03875 [Candidatus Omnitrophica bacterium]|nr:hypothetical protein [Candidatus Omnitrophota bacterium]